MKETIWCFFLRLFLKSAIILFKVSMYFEGIFQIISYFFCDSLKILRFQSWLAYVKSYAYYLFVFFSLDSSDSFEISQRIKVSKIMISMSLALARNVIAHMRSNGGPNVRWRNKNSGSNSSKKFDLSIWVKGLS